MGGGGGGGGGDFLSFFQYSKDGGIYLLNWASFFLAGPIKLSDIGKYSEFGSKEKHGFWVPMPELAITSPYVHSRVYSSTFIMRNPMPESTLTLYQGWLYSLVKDLDLASGLQEWTMILC